MKRALVTGSAGFLGRHFTRRLEADGWDVFGVDLADPREEFDAHRVFRDDVTRYDLVVHAAYRIGGRARIDSDRAALARNLALDAALFEWAYRTRPYRVLYLSSAAVYPLHYQNFPLGMRLQESDVDHVPARLVQPDADYGWAKLTGERLALNAQREGLVVSIVRLFSGYGNGQNLVYPFPAIVRRAAEFEVGAFPVWGPPGQTRDWVHVDDVVGAALAVVESDEQNPVNVCTGIGTEFGQLAKLALAAFGKLGSLSRIEYDRDRPTGVLHRVGDPSLLHSYYAPKISIQEGLHRAARALDPR